MSEYKFNNIKNDIIAFIRNINQFDKCFIVRNVYSRFAIYIIKPDDFNDFESQIKERFSEWVDTIQEFSVENDKFIYEDLYKSSIAIDGLDKVYFSERHVENTNWYIKDHFEGLKTPVTSFYSFKGGVGRTTATILTALLLARKGKKVLLIDFDLEAPGLASVFANQSDNSEALLSVKGFVDFLIEYDANKRDIGKLNIDDYYFVKNDTVLIGNNGGELIIVPAIATDSTGAVSYIDKLSKANLKFGFGKDYIPDLFLKKLEDKIHPDHILIDTRTGINDVGGLVFNRYAQNLFLIFYGNQQNLFGLESITPELVKLNNKGVKFYLVNSPVPRGETDRITEINYYIERSYDIFLKNLPSYKDSPPSLFDITADHYPINIPYNDQALILNSYKKLSSLIDHSDNAYQEITEIILRNQTSQEPHTVLKHRTPTSNILDIIKNIDKGAGTSEIEYKTIEDLKKYFYPRKDYKFIFDTSKFLILGEKGVGKTALFSVLSHPDYAKALAKYCGVNDEISKAEWITGLERDSPYFPDKTNFEALSEFTISSLRNYWVILLLRQLSHQFTFDSQLLKRIVSAKLKDLKDIAIESNIGEDLSEILGEINTKLKDEGKTMIIIYDHLDAVLPSENDVRGKLVSALLTFYYDNINRYENIKAKIFLRKDIFEREVNDITDKVKIQNYSVVIKWDYEQLLNLIWKRIYEQDKDLSIFEGLKIEEFDILGSIPNLTTEEEHKILLDQIFGQNMGGNNKAYPYNWVKSHIEDTNGQLHPRTLIRLFSESAELQRNDREIPKDRIIRSKNIEDALSTKVSKLQVDELKEEYPELNNIFDGLADKVSGRAPMTETDLLNALNELKVKEPISAIDKLRTIGVLKYYKSNPKNKEITERMYHIPDLYLFGLRLNRKGTR